MEIKSWELYKAEAKVADYEKKLKDLYKIEILHGLIWLTLSGYVKDDIDSVIGSFYNGLFWLEEGLSKLWFHLS